MNSLRKILFPFSILYGLITGARNYAFDKGILTSRTFDLPIIAVGNLSVGGTGKSPMIEYLIRLFSRELNLAVLSRGYGRSTKGFYLANDKICAREIGDEPFQFYHKFPDIKVAVDEKRVNGVEQLIKTDPGLELILLDDAFQHRYVKAGFYIMLTAYDDLYINDFMLPAGNLRESRSGSRRAQVIIVSKCPHNLSIQKREAILKRIRPSADQQVFFSSIKYASSVMNETSSKSLDELSGSRVALVTGIANSLPLENYLKSKAINFEHIKFSDHQAIEKKELDKILKVLDGFRDEQKIVITTEKDYVRSFMDIDLPVYYLPIETDILDDGEKFNEIIQAYVRKNKRDGQIS